MSQRSHLHNVCLATLNADGEHHEEALSNSSNKAKENKDHQAIEDLNIISFGNILQGSWIVES